MRILIEARDSDPVKTRIGKTWLLINVDDVNDNAPVIRVNFIIDGANDTGLIYSIPCIEMPKLNLIDNL